MGFKINIKSLLDIKLVNQYSIRTLLSTATQIVYNIIDDPLSLARQTKPN